MADNPQDKTRPPLKTKLLRSQKIIQVSPTDARPQDIPEESEESEPPPPPPPPRENAPPPRSHTPGHLSTKSQDRRKQKSDLSLRQRSQSLSQKESSTPSIKSTATKPPSIHHGSDTSSPPQNPIPLLDNSNPVPQLPKEDAQRPINLRSTSSIAPKAPSPSHSSSPIPPVQHPPRGLSITHPSLPDPKLAANVLPAPASGMYWSRAPVSGSSHTSLRAHTSTLIGSNIYIFGGCDSRSCFNELYVLDADAFYWSTPFVCGDIPAPLRAMTCTAVGKKLIVFGGGDGPAYYNDIYVLDTLNFRWSKPRISGDRVPSKRRAHTACLYKNGIYIYLVAEMGYGR
ncbi:hypothetical protein DID88_008628 [Monilinia fructigena]|uniref:Uncharacterized protein n=1 Tax=Monilinia fructigena TaxID=38457 RepID=A0A395J8D2_9HELO|nr:hypothetical protein DID88_008628 [Monilinia fructigena]